MHWIWTSLNYNMKILQVAFLLLFNCLDSLPKLYYIESCCWWNTHYRLHKWLCGTHTYTYNREIFCFDEMSLQPLILTQLSRGDINRWCWVATTNVIHSNDMKLIYSVCSETVHYVLRACDVRDLIIGGAGAILGLVLNDVRLGLFGTCMSGVGLPW